VQLFASHGSVTAKVTRYRFRTKVTYDDVFAVSNVVANANAASDFSVVAANSITDVSGRRSGHRDNDRLQADG